MAFGNRSAASYDVTYRVNLGQFRAENAEAQRLYDSGVRNMSTEALKLSLAQDKLNVALAKTGGQSRATARAELELRRVQAEVSAQAHRTSGALVQEERSLGRLTRGAVAGSGVFRGFGRSLAFASTAFLGGTGLVYAVRSSIKAAEDHQVVYGQLAAAVKAAGLDYGRYRQQIEAAIVASERLGFTEETSVRSYITLVRATKDATKAQQLQTVAANIARATNKPLETATNAVAKAWAGQNTQLRRLIPGLDNTAKGYKLIEDAQRRTAGAAQAFGETAAGAQERFNVAVHRTEVTIGTALLPTLTTYLDKAATWLDKSRNQERIQRDVNKAVHAGAAAVHVLSEGIHAVAAVLGPVNRALGGFKHTLELVALEVGALKLAGLAGGFRGVAAAEGAAAAQGTVLAGSLARLKAFGAISVLVAVDYELARGAQKLGSFLDRRFPGLFGNDSRTISRAELVNGARSGKYSRGQLEAFRALGANPADVDAAIAALDSSSRGGGFHGHRAPPAKTTATTTTGSSTSSSLPRDQQIALDLARAQARNDQQGILRALNDQVAFDAKYIAIQERLLKTDVRHRKQHAAILQRLYADQASAQGQIDSIHQQAADKAASAAATAQRKREAAARKAAAQARRDGEQTAKELAYAFRQQQKAYEKANREWAREQKALDRAAKAKKNAAGTAAGGPAAGANIAQFLSLFAGLQQFRGNYFPDPGSSQTDTHLYDIKHETRKQTRALDDLVSRTRFPANRYGLTSADSVMGY